MSNLSDLLPTGGGQNAVDFVASGTLSSGQAVVLNSDGTVSAVGFGGPASGTPIVFEAASTYYISSTYDTLNNKIVIVYQDSGNSEYGTAVVGTVNGTSISFGTPVIFLSGESNWFSCTFDTANNKVVIAYSDRTGTPTNKAVVGVVSGTNITFGAAVTFGASYGSRFSATFDSNNNKIVIAYQDGGNADQGTAIVGTVSGTSISFGSSVVFQSSSTSNIGTAFDSNSNKIVVVYRNDGNSSYGTAIVGTVSGTSISFGSAVVFESSRSDGNVATFDSNNNKIVIAYQDPVNTDAGTVIVGTVSGTSISFGSPVVIDTSVSTFFTATFDGNANKVVVSYIDNGNSSYGTAVVGTVSGTSISFGTPVIFENSSVSWLSATFDSSSNAVVLSYRDDGNSGHGSSAVFQTSASNNTDFIGITAEAIADTATGAVNVYGGINEAQSGLTIAADYYVQPDGAISTTVSDVRIGQAISATTINIRDLT